MSTPPFTSPEGECRHPALQAVEPGILNACVDFIPVKGRAGQYFCQICLPPGYKKGQGMKIQAALRHERANAKHLEKVQERIRNDWNYDPPSDWGPIPLPAGTAAWDQCCSAGRAEGFIAFWLDNMTAGERGDKPERMHSFIDKFNKTYQDLLDSWYSGKAQAVDQVEEDEVGEDEGRREDRRNAVPSLWYDEDGFNTVHHPYVPSAGNNLSGQFEQEQWQTCTADPTTEEWVIREDPREEYLPWGFKPYESPDFHASDALPTPEHFAVNEDTRAEEPEWKTREEPWGPPSVMAAARSREVGRSRLDAACRTDVRRGQMAKIY